MYSFLFTLHSDPGFPLKKSVIILAILTLLVVTCCYTVYRLFRFAFKGI